VEVRLGPHQSDHEHKWSCPASVSTVVGPGFVELDGWNLCFCVCFEEAGEAARVDLGARNLLLRYRSFLS